MHRVLLALLLAPHAFAAGFADIQTFDAAHSWTSGNPNPNPPTLLPDSGPLGPGDTALRVSASGGGGAGSKLVIFSTSDWTGNYLAAGISSIRMDLRNAAITPLSIRIALNGPGGWFITPGQTVAPFQPWDRFVYELGAESLLSAGGIDATATLANVGEIRIFHGTSDAAFQGQSISGQMLVDNIQAVPEATGTLFLGLGCLTCLRRKR